MSLSDRFESDLPEDELLEFLSEINLDDDEQTEFYQKESAKLPKPKKIVVVGPADKKERKLLSPEEVAAAMRSAKSQGIAAKRQRAREVKREYVMSGNVHKLSETITNEDKKQIIAYMTEEYYNKANDARNKLTKLIEKELKRFIPMTLKVLYRTNNQAFAEYKGFEYETTPYYGNAKLLIKPDIPNVFSDPNEMQILRAKCSHRLFTFDKLVERYYYMTKRRVQVETNLAIRLSKVKVLLDLIDFGIFYYDAYMAIKSNK